MGSNKVIAIVDYKMGNLFSVKHACEHVGLCPVITSDPNAILSSDGVILPGVGAFGQAMANLKELNLISTLYHFIDKGKPFMGICLGFQLLMSESEEFGMNRGLDVISGRVKKFPTEIEEKKIKVPQIGWNTLIFNSNLKNDHSPLKGIDDHEFMYFVHSYYVETESDKVVLSYTTYEGIKYCSSILKENVFATQFHPEKSGKKGLEIYKKWATFI